MLYVILLGIGLPLVLIAMILPPTLLAGRYASLYESIPPDTKARYNLSPDRKARPGLDWLTLLLLPLLYVPSEPLRPLQMMVVFAGMLFCAVLCFVRLKFYLDLARAGEAVPTPLVTYARYCVGGLLFAGVGSIVLAFLAFVVY